MVNLMSSWASPPALFNIGHQPAAAEHDPRNDVLASAARAERRKHDKDDQPFALETTGGHGVSSAAVYYLSTEYT